LVATGELGDTSNEMEMLIVSKLRSFAKPYKAMGIDLTILLFMVDQQGIVWSHNEIPLDEQPMF